MFMVKSEWKNIWQLTKVKINNTKVKRRNFLLIVLITFLSNFIPTLIFLFRFSEVVLDYNLKDNSLLYMTGFLVAIIVINCLYKKHNHKYSVYPQTNTSRFLSMQILNHRLIFMGAFVSLFLYLVKYIVCAAIASARENIVLAYKFDVGFVITGFIVLLVYGMAALSIITFISVMIRKFKIYAVLCFAILFGGISANVKILKPMIGFLFLEKSLKLFFIKGIVFCFILFIISFIINKYTVYYKSYVERTKLAVVGIVLLGVIITTILNNPTETQKVVSQGFEIERSRKKEIVLDAAQIPAGTKVNIVSSGLLDEKAIYDMNDITDMRIDYDETKLKLENFKGSKIIISYSYPLNTIDNDDLTSYANPQFTAHLDGTTLYLDYRYNKNVKVVFISVWSFMKQFDKYKEKKFFNESDFMGTTRSNTNGNVVIEVE